MSFSLDYLNFTNKVITTWRLPNTPPYSIFRNYSQIQVQMESFTKTKLLTPVAYLEQLTETGFIKRNINVL